MFYFFWFFFFWMCYIQVSCHIFCLLTPELLNNNPFTPGSTPAINIQLRSTSSDRIDERLYNYIITKSFINRFFSPLGSISSLCGLMVQWFSTRFDSRVDLEGFPRFTSIVQKLALKQIRNEIKPSVSVWCDADIILNLNECFLSLIRLWVGGVKKNNINVLKK